MQRPASTRVQFIDVMRLIALAQMVNGHTLNALLDEHLRHGSFYAHYLWFRGLVSVAFMLVAGLAFHLTTLSRWSEHVQNPEARRHRLLRAVELIAIGFLLRFPVSGLLTLDAQAIARGLSGLSQVDVLPCIGMSLLALEGLSRICRRPRQVVFACAALCGGAALLSAWGARLPTDGKLGLLTGWLGPQGGSSFPLLPFSGYVFAGVVIGALALPEGGRTLASRTRSRLLLTAAGLCALALAASVVPFSIVGTVPKFAHSPSFFLQKLAAVSVALWLLTLALSRVTALPRALRVLTGETLGVYVFHLFVLYGFPIGLAKRFGPTLPLTAALSVSAGMLVASVLAGLAWRAIKDLPHTQRFVPSSRAVVFAACLVLGAGGLLFASRSLAEPSANHTSAVRSVSLTVADLEASRDFFVQALGFQAEGAPRQLSGPEFAGLLGVPAAQARSQKLRLGAEMIELVAFAQPAGRPTPADSRSDDLWFQHLALVTSDIDAVHARLAKFKAAAAISAGVQTIPRDNPAAAGIRAFYFRGPAAHPLELIWFPTGKGQPRWQSKAAPLLGIDHTAIAVADSERSRGFYENLLGLHVAGHSFNHGSEQVALSGVPGAQVQITGLRGPQGPGVEFLEYKAPLGGRRTPDDARPSDLWHWETSIAVADLDRTVVQLRAAHAHFISDAIHDTHLFADTARAVLVADPDGHAVRLVQ